MCGGLLNGEIFYSLRDAKIGGVVLAPPLLDMMMHGKKTARQRLYRLVIALRQN
jgi:hypothetical protein